MTDILIALLAIIVVSGLAVLGIFLLLRAVIALIRG